MDEIESRLSELLSRNRIEASANDIARIAKAVSGISGSEGELQKVVDSITSAMAFASRKSRKAIAETILSQMSLEDSHHSSPAAINPRYVVYVATDLEMGAVLKRLKSVTRGLSGNVLMYSGITAGGLAVSAVKTGQGNSAASSIVSANLRSISPAAAVFSGISGALYELPLGTVVIADYVYDYESVDVGDTKAARSKSATPNQRLLQIAGAIVQAGVVGVQSIVMRPIASGEKLLRLESGGEYEWIKHVASDAAVIEMEGLGFLRACNLAGIPGLVVRSVSDHLADKSGSSDRKHQPTAADNAAAVALAILESIAELEGSGDR